MAFRIYYAVNLNVLNLTYQNEKYVYFGVVSEAFLTKLEKFHFIIPAKRNFRYDIGLKNVIRKLREGIKLRNAINLEEKSEGSENVANLHPDWKAVISKLLEGMRSQLMYSNNHMFSVLVESNVFCSTIQVSAMRMYLTYL